MWTPGCVLGAAGSGCLVENKFTWSCPEGVLREKAQLPLLGGDMGGGRRIAGGCK